MKGRLKRIFFFLGVLLLTVGVPILINEAYKWHMPYGVSWTPGDALAYYGALLGAVATIIALIWTISFTRKQILYEKSAEQEKEKWKQVEDLVSECLRLMMPTEIILIYRVSDIHESPANIASALQNRSMKITTSLDWLKCYIRPEEYEKVENYIDDIIPVMKDICDIISRISSQYTQLIRNRAYKASQEKIEIIQRTRVQDDISQYEKIMGENPFVEQSLVFGKINELTEQLQKIYTDEYQNLLNEKRDVFDRIYSEVETQTKKILN